MTQLDPTRSPARLDDLENIIPIEIEPVAPEPSEPAALHLSGPALVEAEESLAASQAEQELTGALAELKRRSARVVDTVESMTTELSPKRIAIGVGVAVGVSLLVVAVVRRARRPRRPRSTLSLIARSLVREAAGRMVLGAAATIGARLAEAAVPMLAAAIVERAAGGEASKRARRASKTGKTSKSRKTSGARKSSKRMSATAAPVLVPVIEPARDDDSKRFGGGTRDAVEEASWESFPASDPAAFYR